MDAQQEKAKNDAANLDKTKSSAGAPPKKQKKNIDDYIKLK